MGTEVASNGEIQPRSYWRWSKQDFFPEESFQSWSNYRFALSQTLSRFKNRLVSKSDEANELGEVRRQSENDMKRCLTWWDLIWFGFGSVIGAGIFVLTGQEAHNHAGPAIVLSYAASGVSAMLSVFCYAEFAVEIPVAGGSFAYLRVELGDFAAFIAAGNILLECIVGNAAVARSWTSYFTTLLNRPSDSLRILTDLNGGYNLLDPIAAAVLLVASAIAMTSTRRTSQLNWIASGCTWSSERNDHSSSRRSTWAGTLYYSHRTISHDSSMVCTRAPKDRNSYIRYTTDCHLWFMYCLLFKLRCSVKFVICQYPLHLYDDVCSTTGEEVLCQRSNSSNKRLEAAYPFASYHWFLHGNFCLLGFKPQRLEGLHRDCSCLVLVNFGDFSSSATAKNTKSLGGSTCSMAAIPLCRNKFVSHGIVGSSGFC